MKVRAKYRVKANGTWRQPGEVFEISTTDTAVLEHVEVVETPLAADSEQPTKRGGRPRKTEE